MVCRDLLGKPIEVPAVRSLWLLWRHKSLKECSQTGCNLDQTSPNF